MRKGRIRGRDAKSEKVAGDGEVGQQQVEAGWQWNRFGLAALLTGNGFVRLPGSTSRTLGS